MPSSSASLLRVVITIVATVGCAGLPVSSVPQTEEGRAALFVDRLATDENGALCATIIERLHTDDVEALTPFIDRAALVERGLARASLPESVAAGWRTHAGTIDELSRYHRPKGSRFYCLGTFARDGDGKVLALRERSPQGQWGYLLLHLTGRSERPFDDYLVVESGLWHSGLQMFFEDPAYAPHADAHRDMLMGSYEDKHREIIATWRALPEAVQKTPLMYAHFLNAVMTVTPAGGERDDADFVAARRGIDAVYSDPQARAAWTLIFAARLGETEAALAAVDTLAGAFTDPLADELRDWVRSR